MKFIADCMLGKLAKWLKLLGLDTVYMRSAEDNELVRIALREDRILLTRDNELSGRKMVRDRALFIESDNTWGQLRQVLSRFEIEPTEEMLFTRCTVCNEPIEEVSKLSVKSDVPEYVYKTQEHFKLCPSCRRIYWRGTHIEHILDALSQQKTTDG